MLSAGSLVHAAFYFAGRTLHNNAGSRLPAVVYALVGFHKISGQSGRDIFKALRIQSVSGNDEPATCTMIRWPRRNVWFTSGMSKFKGVRWSGTIASGCENELRNFARIGSPRTSN